MRHLFVCCFLLQDENKRTAKLARSFSFSFSVWLLAEEKVYKYASPSLSLSHFALAMAPQVEPGLGTANTTDGSDKSEENGEWLGVLNAYALFFLIALFVIFAYTVAFVEVRRRCRPPLPNHYYTRVVYVSRSGGDINNAIGEPEGDNDYRSSDSNDEDDAYCSGDESGRRSSPPMVASAPAGLSAAGL